MDWSSDFLVLAKILLAVLLGAVIGYEREMANKPAGLRTHMLVAASASLLVALGNLIVAGFSAAADVTSDPIRIIEAVIVGVSFLGAGTIFRREGADTVEGLTTGASLLFTATIGVAAALEQYVLCIGATVLILVINRGLLVLQARVGGDHETPARPG